MVTGRLLPMYHPHYLYSRSSLIQRHLVVLDDVVNYPHLRVDNAVATTVFSFSNQDGVGVFGGDGMDGLMSKEDKAYLDNLNVLIDQPFISSITPVEPLVTTEDKSGLER